MTMTRNPAVRDILSQIVNDPRYDDVMRVPLISLPQWALSILALGGFICSSWAYMADLIPLWLAMVVNFVTVYLAFTPLHDSSHRAVSSNPVLNDTMGVLVGQLLMPGVNMTVFRTLHMDHHRFTGQEGRDPDTGLVKVPKWAGVAYLMFTDFHWVNFYYRHARKHWSKTVAVWVTIMLLMVIVSHVALLASPWWKEFLLLYVIPQRVGLGVVAYVFAHIQHPHGLTWDREPFQSTVFIRGQSVLRKLLFGQQDHNIHHLLPHLPWFRYAHVWELANRVLREQRIPSRGVLSGPPPAEMLTPDDTAPITMRVASIRDVGEGIRAFEFVPVNGQTLKAGPAGAHLDIHLPNGLIRQYSIVAHNTQANSYTVAVKRDDQGRGGSKAMHELTVGTVLKVGQPRNHFVLYESAQRFVLISGGIGITPVFHMAQRLNEIGKPYQLHVCARNEAAVPFRDQLTAGPLAPRTQIHLDQANGRSSLDVKQVLGQPDANTLVYLCGPQGFMNWVRDEAIAAGWPRENVRTESFAAAVTADTVNRPFTVELASSKRVIPVKADQSILDALAHVGVNVPFACMQGTCGTCVTDVVSGEVEHRDAYLTEHDKTAGACMCLCVSRARGDKLTLDL
ncbi:MAG TPA: fatty acid desaturase [Macromonas sp.]|nr:fatty acid desaturase [Macromonas sp.]